MEVEAGQLQEGVERMHDCRARLREVVPVVERFHNRPIREGIVHVFEIGGHPTASVCYAWSSPVGETERRRFYAVSRAPPMASPADAVRGAIVEDFRSDRAGG